MAIVGPTDVGATRQDLVASIVQDVLKQESILIPTVANYSQLVGPGQKSVLIPKRAQFTPEDKVEDTDLTGQAMLFTGDTLDLNKHKAIYAELERIAGLQSNVNVQGEILMEQAKALALQIDTDIIVQLKLASSSGPDHIIARTANIDDDIINARKLLNKQIVPMGDRYLVISPDAEAEMLAVDNFIRADAYGSAGGLINGEIGRVFGFTVLMHTGVSNTDFLAYHKSHVGFAMQMSPEYATNFNLKGVKQEYLLHELYGVKVLDSGKRGVYYNATGS